ncbi:MAG: hypothetical protein JSC188_000518 [Candidatus Tokpelaia sp. JSC188]|nr:MAG: hypothetical protein JSC188_000518 [Candidatus Tokpelaia sp. JSC188]
MGLGYKVLKSKKNGRSIDIQSKEQEVAQYNRAAGLSITLLLFALILYVATYAKLCS